LLQLIIIWHHFAQQRIRQDKFTPLTHRVRGVTPSQGDDEITIAPVRSTQKTTVEFNNVFDLKFGVGWTELLTVLMTAPLKPVLKSPARGSQRDFNTESLIQDAARFLGAEQRGMRRVRFTEKTIAES
jgi:hypothetical protein